MSNETISSDSSFNAQQKQVTRREARRKKIGAAAQKAGHFVKKVNQKINPAAWIDRLEQDQDLADRLEYINSENQDDTERRDLKRDAEERCFSEIKGHLESFLETHPHASYENWIESLHPENVTIKDGQKFVDHRFYVESSDHRILWNDHLVDKERKIARAHVPVRTLKDEDASVTTVGVAVSTEKLWH